MSDTLRDLVAMAATRQMSESEREAQRQSFAYGNTHFENECITRNSVAYAAERLVKMQQASLLQ